MPSKHGALVLFGSGPGIGSHVAQHFAKNGFSRIILLSRDAQRLSKEADFVSSGHSEVNIDTVVIDLAETTSISSALAEVDSKLAGDSIEVVIYNAARLVPSDFFSYETADLETDLRVSVSAMYTVAQWAFPALEAARSADHHKPSFLVTSGSLYREPYPSMYSLSACKAAQYILVQSLYKQYSGRGIHCALVVGGVVSAQSPYCSPKLVADKFWQLYAQAKPWSLSLELEDPRFAEIMEGSAGTKG